jgi:hypothetical protein
VQCFAQPFPLTFAQAGVSWPSIHEARDRTHGTVDDGRKLSFWDGPTLVRKEVGEVVSEVIV